MSYKSIYTVLSAGESAWRVVKMDPDWNAEDTYVVTTAGVAPHQIRLCTCFAGSRETCRHRQMVEYFKEENAVDSRRAYSFDKHKWIDPPKASLDML